MTDMGKDNFIKEQLEKDILISKKADEVFNHFLKGEKYMKSNQENNHFVQEEKDINRQKKPKNHGWMKLVSVAACFVVIFAGANVYATTQGYKNVFFMIKDLVNKEENVTITEKSEILSDRDITISYSNIEIAEGLNIQINRLIIKDNEAKLYIRIIKDTENQINIKKYIVTDITGNKDVVLGTHNSTLEPNTIEYTEEIKLTGMDNATQKLKLEIIDDKENTLILLEIDLLNKELDLLSYNKNEIFEKLSETELKEILGEYAYIAFENTSNNIEDMRTNRELDIAMTMVIQKGDKTTKENVHKAIKEYLGKDVTDTILDKTGDIYFENGEYKYTPRDGFCPALVLDIPEITYKDGVYTATIIYCFPGEDWSNIEQLEQYQTTMEFTLNTNYTYTKYCLINADEMVKQVYKAASISVSNVVPNNTEEEDFIGTTESEENDDDNLQNVNNYASTMDWTNYSAPGIRFIYPTIFSVEEIGGANRGNRPGEISTKITGIAIGKDPDTGKIIKSNLTITIYEPLYLAKNVDIRQYTTSSNGYEKAGFKTYEGLMWYEDYYKDDDGSKETYTCLRELTNCYEVYKIEFQTGKDWSFKVRNIINWLLGSTKLIERPENEIIIMNEETEETDVFVTDLDQYNPASNDVVISKSEAQRIAQYGFEESKKRIAGEGADNVDSETVTLEEVYANNYFTAKYNESHKNYMKRMCYIVRRENEMGNGIKIYVDATTGLIVGGAAFGD